MSRVSSSFNPSVPALPTGGPLPLPGQGTLPYAPSVSAMAPQASLSNPNSVPVMAVERLRNGVPTFVYPGTSNPYHPALNEGLFESQMEFDKNEVQQMIAHRYIAVADTLKPGDIAFKLGTIDASSGSKSSTRFNVRTAEGEFTYQNEVLILGNIAHANQRLLDVQAGKLLRKGRLNKPFSLRYCKDPALWRHYAQPMGVQTQDIDAQGGPARSIKLGEPGLSLQHTRCAWASLVRLLFVGESPLRIPAEPKLPQGTVVYLVLMPTKVVHGTTFDIGGKEFYNAAQQAANGATVSVNMPTKRQASIGKSPNDYLWLYQWQVRTTYGGRFNPSHEINGCLPPASEPTECENFPTGYPCYFWRVGHISFPAYKLSEHESAYDMPRAWREYPYLDREVNGEFVEGRSRAFLVNTGDEGFA